MVKQIFGAIAVLVFLSSCSTFKPLNFTSNKQVVSSPAATSSPARFIEDITVAAPATSDKIEVRTEPSISPVKEQAAKTPVREETRTVADVFAGRTPEMESFSSTQLKYAVLLNTEVESLPDSRLLESVDEWYGVRYRTGGNTKSGVDCSGFTVAVYASLYGMMLPRVSREQYRISRKISTTELQQGDLVFFNTNGRGVSHVGVYLGNNKFIHASVSRGVMVNGLFEPYYLKRYVGAGRIDEKQMVSAGN